MSAAALAGLLAGLGIAVPVGAVAAYLVALAARTPLRTGACAALGVATADGLYALVAAAGGATLAPLLTPVLLPLRLFSAAVLLALAVRTGRSAVRRYRARESADARDGAPPSPARAFASLLALTLLNPTTVVYFAALVLGGTLSAGAGPAERAVFVAAAFAASAGWQSLLACGGALLGRALTGDRGRLLTGVVSASLIAALALRLLVVRT
ncbi:LysE family transporter [uncultured Streptomyces sp.]|uniref:LysE family transporter n=1 Tax=uncultured Streptomyces sp. TaxID=174707 RepID=UPI0026112D93|nr:LysE family transporter [uncultured Streptomyces sp.]